MSLLRSACLAAGPRAALAASAFRGAACNARTFTSTVIRSSEKDPQLGDYPDVPYRSYQVRKWDKSWWDGQDKRNFGETLHEEDDLLSVWGPDVHANVKPSSALFQVGIAASCIAAFAGIVYVTKVDSPALPRTFPREGLAADLGNIEGIAAPKEGDFDAKDEEEEDDE